MDISEARTLIRETEEFISSVIKKKYCHDGEETFDDVIERFNSILKEKKFSSRKQLISAMKDGRFISAGSVLYGLGLDSNVSMSNCYFIPITSDSIEGIYKFLYEQAKTYSQRGGVGTDISILRPGGAKVNNAALTSSGAVSFLPLFSENTNTIGQNGRRGAHLDSLWDWHPCIKRFIKCKTEPKEVFDYDYINNHLPNVYYANISVKLSKDFFEAIKKKKKWKLEFPDYEKNKDLYNDRWDGDLKEWKKKGFPTRIYEEVDPNEILKQIAEAAWKGAEPGVLFWDNVLEETPLSVFKEYEPKGVNPCITGDTKIHTNKGQIPIKKIIEDGIDKYKVLTYDTETNQLEYENIVWGDKTRENSEVIEIELINGSKLRLTPDHLVYTKNRGYVEAKDLTEDDDVVAEIDARALSRKGKFKKGINPNRGYCGFVSYKENKFFLRSLNEFYFFKLLSKYNKNFGVEDHSFVFNQKHYKPDFTIYAKDGSILRFVEIKDSKSQVDEYLNVFADFFKQMGVDYWVIDGNSMFKNKRRFLKRLFIDEEEIENFIVQSVDDPKLGYIKELNPFYGFKHTTSTKQRIGQTTKQRMQNEEWKHKWKTALLRSNTEEKRKKISETRQNMMTQKRLRQYGTTNKTKVNVCLNCGKFMVVNVGLVDAKFCSTSCSISFYNTLVSTVNHQLLKQKPNINYNKALKNRIINLLTKYLPKESDFNCINDLQEILDNLLKENKYPKNQPRKIRNFLKYFSSFDDLKHSIEEAIHAS